MERQFNFHWISMETRLSFWEMEFHFLEPAGMTALWHMSIFLYPPFVDLFVENIFIIFHIFGSFPNRMLTTFANFWLIEWPNALSAFLCWLISLKIGLKTSLFPFFSFVGINLSKFLTLTFLFSEYPCERIFRNRNTTLVRNIHTFPIRCQRPKNLASGRVKDDFVKVDFWGWFDLMFNNSHPIIAFRSCTTTKLARRKIKFIGRWAMWKEERKIWIGEEKVFIFFHVKPWVHAWTRCKSVAGQLTLEGP